ncbi:hypothetical protein [Streptomyces daliensis]|uniref:Uncharacterized protein n=1 Tax=Streptomyces daliensis TaxID=299421 RepID=A0A8T4J098_9ACTN|nr:hypothetical protein [Streptomyces daliensis]
MTACALEAAPGDGEDARATPAPAHTSFTAAADGSYAARLTTSADTNNSYPERWTLDGPEPYAVPLPGRQPEEPDAQVLPLADGRVLIARPTAERHLLALLYPTGPGTGELPLGSVESGRLTLLPPAPCGRRAYALVPAPDGRSTGVWLIAGGLAGRPERVADVPGHCAGGAWLDRAGRLLALDRTQGAVTKTVAVDLGAHGAVTPLLQITEDSQDRLLLADPDSGLLLLRSDAPGHDRLGWGVLGSHRPVRFPEVLHPQGVRLTPFAVQPRQVLLPESCAVALRVDGPNGTWLATWRPSLRRLRQFAAPDGWLTGHGMCTEDGELRLPYSTPVNPCGLARLRVPEPEADERPPALMRAGATPRRAGKAEGAEETAEETEVSFSVRDVTPLQQQDSGADAGECGNPAARPEAYKPVPLQQAPLTTRTA